jgi:hypothetical protein
MYCFLVRIVLHSVITWSLGLPNDAQVACGVSVVNYHTELHQTRGATDSDPQVWMLFLASQFCFVFHWSVVCRTTIYVAYLVPVQQPFIDVVDLSKAPKW